MAKGARANKSKRKSFPTPLGLFLLLFVVALTHFPALDAGFIWDDEAIAVTWSSQGSGVSGWLLRPFYESVSYYRPLTSLTFLVDRALFADAPMGFHLTNLALHLLNTLLVFALAKKCGARGLFAAVQAGLWALLPRLTEAVTWVSGRGDLLAGGFVLAGLLCWPWKHSLSRSKAAVVTSAVLLGLGVASKETAVAGFLVVSAVELSTADPKRRKSLPFAASVLALSLGAYVLLRFLVLSGVDQEAGQMPVFRRVQLVFEAIGTNALLLVDLFSPRSLVGSVRTGDAVMAWLGVAVVVALGLAVFFRRTRLRAAFVDPGALLPWALFGASLFVVLPIAPSRVQTVAADRYLYLPTAGLAVLLARTLSTVPPAWGRAALALATGVGLFCIGATRARIGHYQAPVLFWADAVEGTEGKHPVALANLASELFKLSRYEEAARLDGLALQLLDEVPDKRVPPGPIRKKRAQALERAGKYEAALAIRRAQSLVEADNSVVWLELARSLAQTGKYSASADALSVSARLSPGDPQVEKVREGLRLLTSMKNPLAEPSSSVESLAALRQRAAAEELIGWHHAAVQSWVRLLEHPGTQREECEKWVSTLTLTAPFDIAQGGVQKFLDRFPKSAVVPLLREEMERRQAEQVTLEEARRMWDPFLQRGGTAQ